MIKEITKYVFVSASIVTHRDESMIAYREIRYDRDYLFEFETEPSLKDIKSRIKEIMTHSEVIPGFEEVYNICITNMIFLSKEAFETLNR